MAKKGLGILLVYADVDPKYEEEFNAWYDIEHLPELLALAGFLDAARYVATRGGPKYLAVYELESADAVRGPAFTDRKPSPWSRRVSPTVIGRNLTRVLGEQIFPDDVVQPDRGMAPVLLIGRMSVPVDVDAEWNAWYNTELIPEFRKAPGVILSRRYRVVEGTTGYTTVHELESEKVRESAEWQQAHDNPSPKHRRMTEIMTHGAGSPGVYRRLDA